MNKEGHVLNAVLLALGLGAILSIDLGTSVSLPQARTTLVRVAELSLPVTLGALFPDVDTAFGKHRKTLHNLPVLALFLVFPFAFGNLQFVWIGIATHYALDVFGSKRGIALFYPLSSQEYGFPTGVATSSKWANPLTVVITAIELALLGAVHYLVVPLDRGAVQALGALTALSL